MSAANILLQPQAGYLFSDGASWGTDGRVWRIETKLFQVAEHAVICLRGMKPPRFIVKAMIEKIRFDDLLHAVANLARSIQATSHNGHFDARLNFIEVAIVAWDHANHHPRAWRLTGEDTTLADYTGPVDRGTAPFEWSPSAVLSLAPGIDSPDCISKPLRDAQDVFALDPYEDGLALMEAQRRRLVDLTGIGPCHIVGGMCEVARVTESGVTIHELKRWPDKLGERIVP